MGSVADAGGGGGVITNSTSTATAKLSLNPTSGSTTFSGAIRGPVSLVKSGAGTQIMAGASAYAGGTTVSNGTLRVNGSVTGTVNVVSGATLGGTGAITGTVMYASGAFALFTNDAPMRFTGNVTLNNNVVHLTLPDNLPTGTYLLATNTTAGFSGTLATMPVIDSGSLVGAYSTNIVMSGSTIRLVAPAEPTIVLSPDILPAGMRDVGYSQALTDDGGTAPYTNTVISGALPPGLSLAAPGGTLSGTPDTVGTYNFTVQAMDALGYTGSNAYTLVIQEIPAGFFWTNSVSGGWDTAGNWSNELGTATAPLSPGRGYYTLNFNKGGTTITATNTVSGGFLLNQLNFGGATATLAGASMTFTNDGATLPQVNQNSGAAVTIGNDTALGTNVTFGGTGNGTLTLSGALSGAGGLTKTNSGTLALTTTNTYAGATAINGGTVKLGLLAGSLVTPATATSESDYGGRERGYTIDGSGMTPSSPVATNSTCNNGYSSELWLSAVGHANTWITFDLGSIQAISGFHLWNYNGSDNLNRGIQTAGIYIGNSLLAQGSSYASGGSAWGTLVQSFTFAKATAQNTYTGQDCFFTAPVVTRYIQIYVTSNYGDTEFSGLSEIRFYAGSSGRLPSGTALSIASEGAFDMNGLPQTVASLSDSGGAGGLLTNSAAFVTAPLTVNPAATSIFSGAIRGSVGLVKTGSGTQVLAGASTYAGGTTVSNGTLAVSNNAALGVGVVALSGGTLADAGGNWTLANPVNLAGSGSVSVSGTDLLTLGGAITNSGTLTKVGTGTLALTGSNSFSGALTLSASSGAVILSGSNTARPAGTTGLTTVNSGSILQLQANAGNTVSGVSYALSAEQTANQPLILNTGATLQLRSDGDVTFAGANNFGGIGSATVTIDVNQLTAGNTNHTITLAPGGFSTSATVIHVEGGNGYTLSLGNVANGNDAALTFNANTADLTVNTIGTSSRVSGLSVGGAANTSIQSIGGSGTTLTKSGTGVLLLTGVHTYSGATTIQTGTLIVGSAGQLGSGAYSGDIGNDGNLVYASALDQTFSGVISGGGPLVKTNSSTLTLSGPNIYTGMTYVLGGTLRLARAGGTLDDTAPVQVSGGTLDVAQSDTVGDVTMSSGIISGAGTLTGASYALTDSGTISASLGAGAAALTKTGVGVATLTAANSYAGGTTVSSGTLSVSGAGTLGSGDVEVTGGTLALAVSAAIEDDNRLTIDGGAVALAAGVNETVNELVFGAQRMWPGTWGSPDCTTCAYHDESGHLTGTGKITVQTGSPHPATTILFR